MDHTHISKPVNTSRDDNFPRPNSCTYSPTSMDSCYTYNEEPSNAEAGRLPADNVQPVIHGSTSPWGRGRQAYEYARPGMNLRSSGVRKRGSLFRLWTSGACTLASVLVLVLGTYMLITGFKDYFKNSSKLLNASSGISTKDLTDLEHYRHFHTRVDATTDAWAIAGTVPSMRKNLGSCAYHHMSFHDAREEYSSNCGQHSKSTLV